MKPSGMTTCELMERIGIGDAPEMVGELRRRAARLREALENLEMGNRWDMGLGDKGLAVLAALKALNDPAPPSVERSEMPHKTPKDHGRLLPAWLRSLPMSDYARKKAHEAQNRWLNGPGGHVHALESVEVIIRQVIEDCARECDGLREANGDDCAAYIRALLP